MGRNPRRILLALCGVALLLTGCEKWTEWVAPGDKTDLAKTYIADLQAGRYAPIERNFNPHYFAGNFETVLPRVTALFPHEKPKSISLVGANVFQASDTTQYNFTFEYQFSHSWLIANVLIETKAGKTLIDGVHIQPIAQSLEETNAFRLTGKPIASYVVLGLAVLVPLFTFATMIVAFMSHIPRRKWLWIIFIIIGIGQFGVNWTTGQTSYSIFSFLLFGGSALSQSYGPWVIAFSFPLGAILFWERRRGWREELDIGDMRTRDQPG